MTHATIVRDERTESVENSSYRWAYMVLSFGLLGSVVYRAYVLGQSSWDLIALVVIGGVVATVYQGRHGILTSRWILTAVLTAAAAAVASAVIALTVLSR